VRDITPALDVLPQARYPLPKHDPLIANLPQVLARAKTLASTAALLPLANRTLLSPVANPGKLVAAPVNYHAHLDEVRADKALHTTTGAHRDDSDCGSVSESEQLARRAGRGRRSSGSRIGARITKWSSLSSSVNREAVSRKPTRWSTSRATRLGSTSRFAAPKTAASAKSVDTHSVLGPWLVTADEIPNPGDLDLEIASTRAAPRNRIRAI
jgi:hypothetical protein